MPYATHENDVQYLADDGTVLGEVTFQAAAMASWISTTPL